MEIKSWQFYAADSSGGATQDNASVSSTDEAGPSEGDNGGGNSGAENEVANLSLTNGDDNAEGTGTDSSAAGGS